MSLEQKIETLTETMQNLIGALAAAGNAGATASAAVTAAAPKLRAAGKGKPTEPPAAETEPADEFAGSDDGFGAEGEGEAEPDEPNYTIDDVKKALLEMRDVLRTKHGDPEGVKQARVVLAKYTSTTMDAIPEEKFADAIAEANDVIAKTKKATGKKK